MEDRSINKNAFFLFLLDSICNLMGCEMVKGMLQRIGEEIAEKLVKDFSKESLKVNSLESLVNSNNPLSYFDDTLILEKDNIFILEKCPFLELVTAYKKIAKTMPISFKNITDSYNEEGLGYAVSPFCIIHQTYRRKIADYIRVNGETVDLFQLGCKSLSGDIKFAPDNIKSVSLTENIVQTALKEKACMYVIKPKK